MISEEYKSRKKEFLKKAEKSTGTEMKFTTVSGEDVNVLYGPDDIENINYLSEIGFPGEYPYTRGIHVNEIAVSDRQLIRISDFIIY